MENPKVPKKLKIGFIGIGGPGSVGTETVRKLYHDRAGFIEKIYVKNSPSSTKAVINGFIGKELNVEAEEAKGNHIKVEYRSVKEMADECDIIVTAFETTCGAQKKGIPLDDTFRQKLFNGNKEVLCRDGSEEHSLKQGLANYKGLIINATNPLEGMCYWMPRIIPGIKKEQIIGFMPDTDRFNDICVRYFKQFSKYYNGFDTTEKKLLRHELESDLELGCQEAYKDITKSELQFHWKQRDKIKQTFRDKYDTFYSNKDKKPNEEEIKELAGSVASEFKKIISKKVKDSGKLNKIKRKFIEKFQKCHERKYDEIKQPLMAQIYRGFILGEHSPNLVGTFSPIITPGQTDWNELPIEDLNENITKETISWGLELIRERGSTGQEVCKSLANLIKRVYHDAHGKLDKLGEIEKNRICTQTHYINTPEKVLNELDEWLDIDNAPEEYKDELKNCRESLEGLCTGVPVSFRFVEEDGKVGIRAGLHEDYIADEEESAEKANSEYNFNFEKLSKTEEDTFIQCIMQTVLGDESGKGSLLETLIFNEREGKPRYITSDELIAFTTKDEQGRTTIEFKELNKKAKHPLVIKKRTFTLKYTESYDDQIFFQQKYYTPHASAIFAEGNRVVAVACKPDTTIKIWETPNVSVKELIKNKPLKDVIVLKEELLTKETETFNVTLQNGNLFLADLKTIEKRDLDHLTAEDVPTQSIDRKIWSVHSDETAVFCGSQGEIHEFDLDLNKRKVYKTETNNPILKIKTIEFDNTQLIFGIDSQKNIHQWEKGNPTPIRVTQTNGKTFDVQLEDFNEASDTEEKKVLCLYKIGADGGILVDPTPSQNSEQTKRIKKEFTKKIENKWGNYDLFNIQAGKDSLSIITEHLILKIMEKNADIAQDQSIKQLDKVCFVKYRC